MGWVRCGLGTDNTILNLPTTNTASGSIARFNTDLTENLLSAVADFSASQASGTPTPANPISIVGVDKVNVALCGSNLWDEEWESGDVSSTTGKNSTNANNIRSKNYIAVKGGESYYFYCPKSIKMRYYRSDYSYIGYLDKNGAQNAYKNVRVMPDDCAFIRFAIDGQTTYSDDISINYPSTDTEYHAYTGGTTALINLGGTYYGGEVDAVTGKITLTHKKYIFDENLQQSSFGLTAVTGYTQLSYSPYIYEGKANTIFLSDKFGFETGNVHSVYKCWNTTSVLRMFLALPDTVATKADAISWFQNNPTEVIAELATPIVVYASNTAEIPTINGNNNCFCNTGNVSVKYNETVAHHIS